MYVILASSAGGWRSACFGERHLQETSSQMATGHDDFVIELDSAVSVRLDPGAVGSLEMTGS
jgi:hypothetical protein